MKTIILDSNCPEFTLVPVSKLIFVLELKIDTRISKPILFKSISSMKRSHTFEFLNFFRAPSTLTVLSSTKKKKIRNTKKLVRTVKFYRYAVQYIVRIFPTFGGYLYAFLFYRLAPFPLFPCAQFRSASPAIFSSSRSSRELSRTAREPSSPHARARGRGEEISWPSDIGVRGTSPGYLVLSPRLEYQNVFLAE